MSLNPSYDFTSAVARRLLILVADDAAGPREAVRQWLEDMGHTVLAASGGNEATRLAAEHAVDLVITEVIMPDGDGLELILALKKNRPDARVLAVSGGGHYLPVSDCLRVAKGLGAHAVLAKPIAREELLGMVEQLAMMLPATVG